MNPKLTPILQALSPLIEPKLKWQIGELNLIKEIRFEEDGSLYVRIDLISDSEEEKQAFTQAVEQALAPVYSGRLILNLFKVHVALNGLEGVKRVVLVGSGKGGVGKSTIAVNLAAGLQRLGYAVGVIDADIQGPSQPTLLGCKDKPQVLSNEMLLPLEAQGLKLISTGSLVDPNQALAWRGQLVSGTLLQFIRNTAWGKLDYLVIDLPPGTGEVQLTLAAELKADGLVLVSMPQEVVLGDVRRSLDLFQEKQIPILGLVENMASYQCPDCGSIRELFPHSSTALKGLEHLAKLPLDPALALASDQGHPLAWGEGATAEALVDLAKKVAAKLPI